ncbi:hypothetical protein JG688_00009650, partial [Phytophthora aleatoria]
MNPNTTIAFTGDKNVVVVQSMSENAFRASVFVCTSATRENCSRSFFFLRSKRRRPRGAFKPPAAPRAGYAHGTTEGVLWRVRDARMDRR